MHYLFSGKDICIFWSWFLSISGTSCSLCCHSATLHFLLQTLHGNRHPLNNLSTNVPVKPSTSSFSKKDSGDYKNPLRLRSHQVQFCLLSTTLNSLHQNDINSCQIQICENTREKDEPKEEAIQLSLHLNSQRSKWTHDSVKERQ